MEEKVLLSEQQIEQIFKQGMVYILTKNGFTLRQIVDYMKNTDYQYSLTTVQSYVKEMNKDNYVFQPLVLQREKPYQYTEEQAEKIVEHVESNPEVSLRMISENKELNPNNLHFTTIGNLLKREDIENKPKLRTFTITEEQIQRRYQYACKREHQQKKFWQAVWFTDESKLCTKRKGKDTIWIHKDSKKNQKQYLKEESKWNDGLEVQVFGAISINDPEYIEWYEPPLNAERYQSIIEQGIINNSNFNKYEDRLMQDNASVLTCKSTQKFLEENEITLIGWPTKGADLNPIEKIWAEIKNMLYQKRDSYSNKEEIWALASEFFFSEKVIKMTKKFYYSQHLKIKLLKEIKGERLSLQ